MKVPILRINYSEEDISFIKDEIEKVLLSGHLTMARNVKSFEDKFASYCDVKYAVGTNSGTSALEIILRAIDVEKRTIVMPSNTYMATAFAAIKAGAKIIFCECEKENLQMSPDDLRQRIQADTRAVILVHIGGIISSRVDEIRRICEDYNLALIEDAAHAHGAVYKNSKAGSLGVAGAFSFYPTKVLTTGEGGIITTNDKEIYEKALILREHGKEDSRFNVHIEIGDNWRFSELHAVLGLQQMKKVEYILSERRRLAALYDSLLADVDFIRPVVVPDDVKPSYYKYIVFLADYLDRSIIKTKMRDEFGVELTGEVYSNPCHMQPVFKKYPEKVANDGNSEFPITNYVCERHICLPLYPGLRDEEATYVVDCLKETVSSYMRY